MAIVFLDVVNETLKRVGAIQGDTGNLVTATVTGTATGAFDVEPFERSAIQRQVDVCIQLWREGIHELYVHGLFAREAASATFTFASDTREYTLPNDFERIAGDGYVRGATTGLVLTPYPGGYAKMLADQPRASDWVGDPGHFAFSPATDTIRFDRTFATQQAGHVYNMLYERSINFTSTMATAELPFSDTVSYDMVPTVAEFMKRWFKQEFDDAGYRQSLVRSLQTASKKQPMHRYGRRPGVRVDVDRL
jgi:hypothetical protein